jgi:glycosyltransferase involved in cell wall biosynthesis
MISLIIPSYNNLRHLKNAYESIKKHAPTAEIILLDDGSTDGTWDWMKERYAEDENLVIMRVEERTGHTILYDQGIEYATNEIVGILHADMIIGPSYIENLVKHLQPGKVVCATRIEPPLHPPGKEKIIMDFGQDFDTLNIDAFEEFAMQQQEENVDRVTYGMFAPWILYKSDFQAIGGHDPLFAPFPYEDSDIFQRWILAGYELIQSRDAFVYHLTCRGHRWTEQVGQDDEYYKQACTRASRNYLRKWGSWIKNNEYQYPIIIPKYNIAFVVHNCTLPILEALEPWCDRIYIDDDMQVITTAYIEKEQPNTKFDLTKRVLNLGLNYPEGENDIVVVILDASQLGNHNFQYIQQLPEIIADNGAIGEFKLDCFTVIINHLETYEKNLIKLNQQHIYL